MTETVRTDDADRPVSDLVPAAGTVASAVTLAGVLVPLQRGAADPAVGLAAALAVVALLAFLASRHGLLERRLAGPVAAGSSLAVVLLAGYAMNRGITAPIEVLGSGFTLSSVALAFAAAGIAVGVGVADYAGIGVAGLKERSLLVTVLAGVGFAGLFGAQIATLLFAVPVVVTAGELSSIQSTAIGQLGTAVGMGAVALGYLRVAGYGLEYVDLRTPTKRDALWAGIGLVLLFGAVLAIGVLFTATGVESSDHGTAEQAQEAPEMLLVLIPASLLIIGPFEELLYRNVVQKRLYDRFSRPGAVVVASVVFGIIHASAYATAALGEVVASLATVFGLAIVLGTLYERTDNLVVPALVHGAYNAILFANLYVSTV